MVKNAALSLILSHYSILLFSVSKEEMDSKSNTRNFLVKPASAAAIVGVAASLWRPGTSVRLPMFSNGYVPYAVAAAGITFAVSEGVGLIDKYIFPNIPVVNLFEAPAEAALNVGAFAGTTLLLEKLVSPDIIASKPIPELLVFAVMAELGSTYVADNLIIPSWNRMYPSMTI